VATSWLRVTRSPAWRPCAAGKPSADTGWSVRTEEQIDTAAGVQRRAGTGRAAAADVAEVTPGLSVLPQEQPVPSRVKRTDSTAAL
jgi:hypothetical protein